MKVPIGVSVRHAHLKKEHLEILFGKDYRLLRFRELYQPIQYASNYTVTIRGPKGQFHNVRILGPEAEYSQVELSRTDAYYLGIDPPVRISGNLAKSAPITIIGPLGVIELEEGCIIANRHIHIHTKEAEKYNINQDTLVDVKLGSVKPTILREVSFKIADVCQLELHIDTDDANAALVNNGEYAHIILVEEIEVMQIDS